MGVLFATMMGASFVGGVAESNILRGQSLTRTNPDQRAIVVKGRTYFVSQDLFIRERGGEITFLIGCALLVCLFPLYKRLQPK